MQAGDRVKYKKLTGIIIKNLCSGDVLVKFDNYQGEAVIVQVQEKILVLENE